MTDIKYTFGTIDRRRPTWVPPDADWQRCVEMEGISPVLHVSNGVVGLVYAVPARNLDDPHYWPSLRDFIAGRIADMTADRQRETP